MLTYAAESTSICMNLNEVVQGYDAFLDGLMCHVTFETRHDDVKKLSTEFRKATSSEGKSKSVPCYVSKLSTIWGAPRSWGEILDKLFKRKNQLAVDIIVCRPDSDTDTDADPEFPESPDATPRATPAPGNVKNENSAAESETTEEASGSSDLLSHEDAIAYRLLKNKKEEKKRAKRMAQLEREAEEAKAKFDEDEDIDVLLGFREAEEEPREEEPREEELREEEPRPEGTAGEEPPRTEDQQVIEESAAAATLSNLAVAAVASATRKRPYSDLGDPSSPPSSPPRLRSPSRSPSRPPVTRSTVR